MNDDFSYAHTARVCAETGRVSYNGWGSPLMLPQAYVGGLVIRIFGWGYTQLAWVSLVSGSFSAALMFLLARRCGCSRSISALVTGLLTLNPIYLGVMPTFLTEMFSLFLFLLSLLLLAYAVCPEPRLNDEPNSFPFKLSNPLLVASLVVAILAGANRQILWLAMLGSYATLGVIMPSRVRMRQLLPVCLLLLLAASVGTLWGSAQPYIMRVSYSDSLQAAAQDPWVALVKVWRPLVQLGMLLSFLVFPLALSGRVVIYRRAVIGTTALFGGLLLLILIMRNSRGYLRAFPFSSEGGGNYFTEYGVMVGGVNSQGVRQALFGLPSAMILYGVGIAALAIAAGIVVALVRTMFSASGKATAEQIRGLTVLGALPLQVLFALPWYAEGNFFDRYFLLMLPCIFPVLGSVWPPRPHSEDYRGVSAYALAATGLFATMLLGFLFSQEYFSLTRARADIYRSLRGKGATPQEIDAGVELCGDTQLSIEDHVNHPKLGSLAHGYDPRRISNVAFWFPQCFPVVHAQYQLTLDPHPNRGSSVVHNPRSRVADSPIEVWKYHSLLPPRQRTVYVFRLLNSSTESSLAESHSSAKPQSVTP